jgi:hypothetical protein
MEVSTLARTGRPPKPIEQKRRTGNPGKRPLPASGSLAVVPAVAAADHELSVDEALDRVLGAGVHWLARTDGPTIALLRDAVEDYAQLRGTPGVPPKEVREARAQVMALLSQLGFDPTSRSRLGLAEVKAQSKLEEIRARRGQQTEVVDGNVDG